MLIRTVMTMAATGILRRRLEVVSAAIAMAGAAAAPTHAMHLSTAIVGSGADAEAASAVSSGVVAQQGDRSERAREDAGERVDGSELARRYGLVLDAPVRVSFDGGTVEEYVDRVAASSGVRVVVVLPEAAAFEMPAVDLEWVTYRDALRVVPKLTYGAAELAFVGDVVVIGESTQGEADARSRSWSLEPLIEPIMGEGFEADEIIDAMEKMASMAGGAELVYQPSTRLLLGRGSEAAMEAADSAYERLSELASFRATRERRQEQRGSAAHEERRAEMINEMQARRRDVMRAREASSETRFEQRMREDVERRDGARRRAVERANAERPLREYALSLQENFEQRSRALRERLETEVGRLHERVDRRSRESREEIERHMQEFIGDAERRLDEVEREFEERTEMFDRLLDERIEELAADTERLADELFDEIEQLREDVERMIDEHVASAPGRMNERMDRTLHDALVFTLRQVDDVAVGVEDEFERED
jgi:hypothetical protein